MSPGCAKIRSNSDRRCRISKPGGRGKTNGTKTLLGSWKRADVVAASRKKKEVRQTFDGLYKKKRERGGPQKL